LYRGVIIYTAGLVRLRKQAYNLASTEYNYLTLIILTNYLSVKKSSIITNPVEKVQVAAAVETVTMATRKLVTNYKISL